jgi:hypothetical protein
MDASKITFLCGVILAVCVLLCVYVGVSKWISNRTKVPLILTVVSVCMPNAWLGLLIAAIIHS